MSDDDFGFDDAFIVGGIAGFIQDSVEEERPCEEAEQACLIEDELEDAVDNFKRQDEMIRNTDPDFSDWVIRKALQQRQDAEIRQVAEEVISEYEEDDG